MRVEILPERIRPATQTTFSLPPDKSILHRVLFIGSLTKSAFTIPIPSAHSVSHDIIATVLALESLGVPIEIFDDRIELQGVGRNGYRAPTHLINCANSGTTARLLMGLLAGQDFDSILTGDDSLLKRPMQRLADHLERLGAAISTEPQGTLPATISGRKLHCASVQLPVASAQMKTAVLLAGLLADGTTTLTEPWQSRDHTERMLAAFGYALEVEDLRIRIDPSVQPSIPDEITFRAAGDISCAAFLAVAAILLKVDVTLEGVLLNASRTRFLDLLALAGVELEATNITEEFNEERGDLLIRGSVVDTITPFDIEPADVPLLIDELPVLFVLAAFANGESIVRGARELRLKESDRLHSVAEQLLRFGVAVTEFEDGLSIHGLAGRTLSAAKIDHYGDHRLAMAFAIAALFCDKPSAIDDAEAASISYPDFYNHLSSLTGGAVMSKLANA